MPKFRLLPLILTLSLTLGVFLVVELILAAGTTTAHSFQRKTWFDGTRYWRAFQDSGDGRIEFEYSTDGSSWTEDTSARITTNTTDFSVHATASEAYVAYTTPSTQNTDNLVTDSGLVAYWRMNEGSWNGTTDEVVDSSGNANHGTRVDNATTTTGKFGNGGTFDGTGDQVNVDDHTSLHPGTGSWSMTGWLNPNNADQSTVPYFKFNGGTVTGFALGVSGSIDGGTSGKKITGFLIGSGGANLRGVISNASVVDGSWHHVAVVFDQSANSATIYIDGSSVAATTDFQGSWPNVNNTDALTVGTAGYTGLLDDMRLYNRAITADEAAALGQPGYDIEVRKAASYPGTGFSWDNPTVAYNGASATNLYQYPVLTEDSSSKIWLGASRNSSGTYTFNAARSTSASSVSAWDSATALDSSANSNKYGVLVPRSSGAAYAVWIDGTAIEGKNYNGSAWDGSPTAIDTGVTGLTKSLSAVADSSGNVYLVYVSDEATDQISGSYYNGTSWSSPALVADAGSDSDSYPTVTLDTTNGDLYAFWIDTSSADIFYSVCDTSSGCDSASEWSAETSWQTTGTNVYVTGNYSGAALIFATWFDGTNVVWDDITISGNSAPGTPSLDAPTDGSTGQSLTPALKTTSTDADADYLRYKIELCLDSAMTLGCSTFDQTSSQTGWSGQDTETSTAYASGTQATYTLQSALAYSQTYYWHSYAKDPGGSDTWSSTQSTPYSFTTLTAPTAYSFQRKTWVENTPDDNLPITTPLEVSADNARYFADGSGNIVYLTGSHTWMNLQDIDNEPFDFDDYLNFEASQSANYIRLWSWEQSSGPAGWDASAPIDPMPFTRTGPGNANDGGLKFDLTSLNQDYFDRMRERVIAARDRGIYVSIQLFNGFSVGCKPGCSPDPFPNHPMNTANNINSINGDPNADGDGWEVHTLADSAITTIQESYVEKVIDTVNDLPNVLYEIVNEPQSDASTLAWIDHMIDLIHTYEAGESYQHPVGMGVAYPSGSNPDLFASDAEFIMPNNSDSGGYDYITNPRPSNGSKVIIGDTDHLYGLGGDRVWAWKSFARGIGLTFMDCYNSIEGNFCGDEILDDDNRNSLLKNLGFIRNYSQRLDLTLVTPSESVSATGYALAYGTNPNNQYLAYQPGTGAFNMTVTADDYYYEWFNPATGLVAEFGTVTGTGSSQSFTPPFSGDAVLYLRTTDYATVPHRYWRAVNQNSRIEFYYSQNFGSSWTEASTARINVDTADFSVWTDQNNVYLVYRDGFDIKISSALSYPSQYLAWNTPVTVFDGSSATNAYYYPTVAVATDGRIWAGATRNSSGTFTYNARRTTNPGFLIAWDSASALDSSASSNKFGQIVSRPSAAAYAVWIDGTTIEGKSYSGSWAGSPTTIDTGLPGLSDSFSATTDSSGNVYLLYISDETTDQVSSSKYNGTSWTSAALVADAADGNDTYPTLAYDSEGGDLYAFWIDSSTSDIFYSSCDASTSCDSASEWSAETSWQTSGTNSYLTANFAGYGHVFAAWSDGATPDWGRVLPLAVVSITLTTDGTVSYGILPVSSSQNTVTLTDTQTIANNGNVSVDLDIQTTNATGGTTWTLGGSIGSNIFTHEFSTNGGGAWTPFTAADSYQSLLSDLIIDDSTDLDLRLTLPSSTSDFVEKSLTVTVLASET